MQFYSAPHLQQLGVEYPRFLAFMRQVERRKESGRQSLSDLLVRPVQRLPSMLLIVQGNHFGFIIFTAVVFVRVGGSRFCSTNNPTTTFVSTTQGFSSSHQRTTPITPIWRSLSASCRASLTTLTTASKRPKPAYPFLRCTTTSPALR